MKQNTSMQEKRNEKISEDDIDATVIKGKSDWRKYSSKVLPNGIKCMFVQDKESKTTAMSVCVKAGASSDPRERSGLAHFCEHMCFLGSEKYPGENEFKKYLSMHGGRSNASTSMQTTTYHFDVLASNAENAVDMFSTFFTCPLFTESGTYREVNAVDSENSKNLTNDNRRRLQIYKSLADPNHSYSKFSTGNNRTLLCTDENNDDDEDKKTRIREELLAFHMRHYRPMNMVVVIVGPQELDVLSDWIVTRFKDVEDRWDDLKELTDVQRMIDEVANDAPTMPSSEYIPAFRPDLQQNAWPVLLTVLPLKERRKVYLSFPVPPIYNEPDNSPMKLISHLLGHEGKGSCFAYLQNKGYISALSSGYRINAPDQCMFTIDISLTEDGERSWKQVLIAIFQYCNLINKTALTAQQNATSNEMKSLRRIWSEVADLSRIHFHNTSPGIPYSFASRLASKITSYDNIHQCLSIGSMLNENENTLPINDIINYSSKLIPTNCIIERCSKQAWDDIIKSSSSPALIIEDNNEIFGLKKEKWYDIEYYLSKIHDVDVSIWENQDIRDNSNQLHLPSVNRYIPKHLELCNELPPEAKVPRIEHTMYPPDIVQIHSYGRLWHKLDDRYALPKSHIKLLFRNPIVDHSLTNAANTATTNDNTTEKWTCSLSNNIHSSFLISMFTDALSQETYDADLSGLYWSLNKSSYGLQLDCYGYSERLSIFAYDILNKLCNNNKDDDNNIFFLQDSFLVSSKDRFIRATRSFLASGRADSHAAYYMDLLLSSEENGNIDEIVSIVDNVTLDSLRIHYEQLMEYNTSCCRQDNNAQNQLLECLYQGNVSRKEACVFFDKVCNMLLQTYKSKYSSSNASNNTKEKNISWIPGPSERKLIPGNDIELHFSSQNPSEENGAVIMAFQSSLPGYRGETGTDVSSSSANAAIKKESLIRTSSLRLLCHMLHEPFFNDLRTKQQLGYIVNSSYHTSLSTIRDTNDQQQHEDNSTTTAKIPYKIMTIEYIYMTILSRKALPTEIGNRIDNFLQSFRNILQSMPESEIKSHSNSLCIKMLKPIQKLNNEVNFHFGKIRRFAPEVLSSNLQEQQQQIENSNNLNNSNIPWNTIEDIAGAVSKITRKDLLHTWDAVVSSNNRSRVASKVYGKDFPLVQKDVLARDNKYNKTVITTVRGILQSRNELARISPNDYIRGQRRYFSTNVLSIRNMIPNLLWNKLQRNKLITTAAATTAVVVLGVGIIGVSTLLSNQCRDRITTTRPMKK